MIAPSTATNSSNDDSCSYSSKNSTLSHRISLPVPDQVSRDKIQNKLRYSTSLLSLNSKSSLPMNKNDHDETLLRQILLNCDIKRILNPAKGDVLPLINDVNHLSSIQLTSNVWQIGEVICKKFLSVLLMTLHGIESSYLCRNWKNSKSCNKNLMAYRNY